jgi:hypothetical protein
LVDREILGLLQERLQAVHVLLRELKAAAHAIELQQPERVRVAKRKAEGALGAIMQRADAGRGDGNSAFGEETSEGGRS